MGQFVKSTTDTQKLNRSVEAMTEELKYYKKASSQNTKELQKVNEYIAQELEIAQKAQEKKLSEANQTDKWVRTSPPAINVAGAPLLKRLNIL